MTHRTVEGSPESGNRITPDESAFIASPALSAPPQGEREAFEAWLKTDWIGRGYPADLWSAFQAGRASLSASTPSAAVPGKASLADAPKVLNINDRAMWVLGWNECVAAMATPADNKENG